MRVSSSATLPLLCAVICVSASLVSHAAGAGREPRDTRPNVVLILADDLGWNDVGYHGSEIRTPNLDALARTGVILHQFHSQPTCTPTRAALLTGKSPQRMGIYRQFAKNATNGLPATEATLADYLSDAGYQTWLIGKWHLGHAEQKYHPNARGFDHFYGHVTGGIGYWDHVHGGGLDWQRNGVTVRETGYSTHLLAAEAVHLTRQRDTTRPFFLYASFNAPHLPNEAPADSVDGYAGIDAPNRRMHAAMVTEMDTAVGRIVAQLERAEVLDNTLIWFMSDNGGLNRGATPDRFVTLAETLEDWFGAPLPVTILEFIRTNALEGGADNTPLRSGKGSVYEGGVRVPSFVHMPRDLEPHRIESMISVQDVLPTLLAAANIETPGDLDGRNRWPLLRGIDAPPPADYITIGQSGAQAYYRWPWKLIAAEDKYELYNLETDPVETNDLSLARADQADVLRSQLNAANRAPSLHIPLYRVFWDPDFFGGEEDRPPWADVMSTNAER